SGDERHQRAERRDVDGVPHRLPKPADERPVRRHHAHREIAGLGRRVGDELPDGLVRDQLPAIDKDSGAGEPRRPYGELRAALTPSPALGCAGDGARHHCTHRRKKPDEYSTSITMAMITSRIAAAEPNS